ncbi:phosphatidylethanolamine-binding protein [Xylariales sp. PMI_506]|nr:phosphatidylethanolamine-binding protein [Xylariales sp. PMI_506]
MFYKYFAVLAVAPLSLAATPQGFQPASQSPLIVSFDGIDASGGAEVDKSVTKNAPQLGTSSQLTGASYAVIMLDIDVPNSNSSQGSAVLHWIQTGLTQKSSASTLNTGAGKSNVFMFSSPEDIAAIAPYNSPAPPPKNPLSHRYVQLLVDTSEATSESYSVLTSAAQNRTDFNTTCVLTRAGLLDSVVAGNFFNVSTYSALAHGRRDVNATASPGPSSGLSVGPSSGSSTASSTGISAGPSLMASTTASTTASTVGSVTGSATGSAGSHTSVHSDIPVPTAEGLVNRVNHMFLGVVLAGAAFACL